MSFHGPLIGDAGAAALLGSFRRLRKLELLAAGVGPATVEEVAAWPGLARLRELTLYFNGLTAAALRPLGDRFGLRLRD